MRYTSRRPSPSISDATTSRSPSRSRSASFTPCAESSGPRSMTRSFQRRLGFAGFSNQEILPAPSATVITTSGRPSRFRSPTSRAAAGLQAPKLRRCQERERILPRGFFSHRPPTTMSRNPSLLRSASASPCVPAPGSRSRRRQDRGPFCWNSVTEPVSPRSMTSGLPSRSRSPTATSRAPGFPLLEPIGWAGQREVAALPPGRRGFSNQTVPTVTSRSPSRSRSPVANPPCVAYPWAARTDRVQFGEAYQTSGPSLPATIASRRPLPSRSARALPQGP